MKKTTNYHLSQWVGTDRILRENFNADNAAVDAALKANADAVATEKAERTAADTAQKQALAALEGRLKAQPILTSTLSGDQVEWKISLAGVDWSKYSMVCMDIRPNMKPKGEYTVYLNDDPRMTLVNNHRTPVQLLLFPFRNPDTRFLALCFGRNNLETRGTETFRDLISLRLFSGGHTVENTMLAGSTITIYGA